MKRIVEVLSIIFIISGFLFVSCSREDTALKTEGTTEKGMYGEKAGEAIESVKETVSEQAKEIAGSYGEKAGEAIESVKETVSEKAADTMTDYTDKAKEKVYGYTAPEKEAAGVESEQASEK